MAYITDKFDEEVIRLLREGTIGCMPSDTIYGLSCLALDKGAVDKLNNLKHRSPNKPYIVLISNKEMLNMLSIEKSQTSVVEKYWPGPVTFVCQAPDAPDWLHSGLKTVAVRVPADEELTRLIEALGPVVSTSANPEGQQPARSTDEAITYFGNSLGFYVNKGVLEGKASTLVRNVNGKLEVIRQGEVEIKEEDK